MIRKSHRVPKYGLHKKSGLARVIVDGQSIYLGKHNSCESHEKYARIIAELASNGSALALPATPPNDLTVNELLVAYFRYVKSYYVDPDGNPTKEISCIRYAIRPLKELYGSTLAIEFGPLA